MPRDPQIDQPIGRWQTFFRATHASFAVQAVRVSAENIDASSTGRILAAAEALFALHGYDAVSMSAITVHAGVSKANIFHHFSSKNALCLAVLRTAC